MRLYFAVGLAVVLVLVSVFLPLLGIPTLVVMALDLGLIATDLLLWSFNIWVMLAAALTYLACVLVGLTAFGFLGFGAAVL